MRWSWIVVLVLALLPGTASAAFEGVIEIWQPFLHRGENSIRNHPVPYATFSSIPIKHGFFVVQENRTPLDDGEFENRNLASLCGLRLSFPSGGDGLDGQFGDTLKVVLDATGFVSLEEHPIDRDVLLCRTTSCIRATTPLVGGSPGNRTNFLEVRVLLPEDARTILFDLRQPFDPRTDHPAGICPRED